MSLSTTNELDRPQLDVRVFGRLVGIVGTAHLRIRYQPDTATLREALEADYPTLASETFAIAIDRVLSNGTIAVARGADVALLPPFSGG